MELNTILELLLLLAVAIIAFVVNMRSKISVGDHYYHPQIIQAIRKNGHRFIREHPCIAYEENFAYPQLLHWMLSFFPERMSKYLATAQYTVFSFSGLLVIYFFANTAINQQVFGISAGFITAVIFLLTPFNFSNWNSKNSGYSARGIGIFLGQLFLVITYSLEEGMVSPMLGHLLIIMNVLLVLISSQFAAQFVALGCMFFAICLLDAWFLIDLILGFVLFLAVTGAVGIQFLKGQIAHKILYSTKLYITNILAHRKTIYRDLVWDIWLYLKDKPVANIPYALYNPVVTILLLMPCTLPFLVSAGMFGVQGEEIDTLTYMAVCGYVFFFLTSFKRTRFLGEPERYVEMVYPFAIIAMLHSWMSSPDVEVMTAISWVLAVSLPLILVQLIYAKKDNKANQTEIVNKGEKLKQAINSIIPEGARVIANTSWVLNPLLDSNHKIMRPILSSLLLRGFTFDEIYDASSFRLFSAETIMKLASRLEFDILILDHTKLTESDRETLLTFLGAEQPLPIESYDELFAYRIQGPDKQMLGMNLFGS